MLRPVSKIDVNSLANPSAMLQQLAAAARTDLGTIQNVLRSLHAGRQQRAAPAEPNPAGAAAHQQPTDDHNQQHCAAERQQAARHQKPQLVFSQQQLQPRLQHWQHARSSTNHGRSIPHVQLPLGLAATATALYSQRQLWPAQQLQQRAYHPLQQQRQWQQQQQQQRLPVAVGWLVGQAWRGLQHNRPGPPTKRVSAPPKPKPADTKPSTRRNHQITAKTLMVVFPDGSKEVLDVSLAREAARALDLDLVEVNPRAKPPVARIMDYGKMVYEQKQKADAVDKANRRREKLASPKEMQFSARIADHDLEVKLKKVAGWLEQGYRVQLVVKHGREEEPAAQEALDYLLVRLQADFSVEAGEKQTQRRAVSLLVKPTAAAAVAAAKQQQQQSDV